MAVILILSYSTGCTFFSFICSLVYHRSSLTTDSVIIKTESYSEMQLNLRNCIVKSVLFLIKFKPTQPNKKISFLECSLFLWLIYKLNYRLRCEAVLEQFCTFWGGRITAGFCNPKFCKLKEHLLDSISGHNGLVKQ